MKKIIEMLEEMIYIVRADDIKDQFTDETFYKNFVLGSEFDIVNEYMNKGFNSFKNFIQKSNTNNNAFNFFYQVHTSLERAMKIVLTLSIDDYKEMNFVHYSHNINKLLVDTKELCNFNDDEVKFINSLDGKYKELRYKNFDALKLNKDKLSNGFHTWELIKWVNDTLGIKLSKGKIFMWDFDNYNEDEIGKKILNRIVKSVEKLLLNICGKIAKYISKESKKLNIRITENHGRFYNEYNLGNK